MFASHKPASHLHAGPRPSMRIMRIARRNPGAGLDTVAWNPHIFVSKQEQHLAILLEWVAEYYSRNDDTSLWRTSLSMQEFGREQWLIALTDQVQPAGNTP